MDKNKIPDNLQEEMDEFNFKVCELHDKVGDFLEAMDPYPQSNHVIGMCVGIMAETVANSLGPEIAQKLVEGIHTLLNAAVGVHTPSGSTVKLISIDRTQMN